MNIKFGNTSYDFVPWRPELGRVFSGPFAFDSETSLIDNARPWITPAYVLGAAFDGQQGYFIRREHLAAFFQAHQDVPVVMHNAPFDLAVINTLSPGLDIYSWVDHNLVHDTQLLHRLYMLATEGHTAFGRGQSTLERCAACYLGLELPKDIKDNDGNDVRMSYGRWLSRPPNQIEPVYLEYLAKDVVATYGVIEEQNRRFHELFRRVGADIYGYVSREWLNDQVARWGWQTHHLQLKAAIVLDQVTANGLAIDVDRRDELSVGLQEMREEHLNLLHEHGYIPGQTGCNKALQEIMRRLERRNPQMPFPRTASGQYATSEEALQDLQGVEPFVDAMLAYKAVTKLENAFLAKMGQRRVHPSFDVLKTTGRTSSFGEINAQNLPRDDRIRACFIPSPGHVFIAADYSTLELATLSQAVVSQFGQRSLMAEQINAGKDLHRLVAARVTGKDEADVTRDERQKAKAINFGKPGGMGNRGLQQYAKGSYDVEFSDDEVQELTDKWFLEFPEMENYLSREGDTLAFDVAAWCGLTPTAYAEHTGSTSWLNPMDPTRNDQPHAILGAMFLRTLRDEDPHTRQGEPYDEAMVDFFWARLGEHMGDLPSKLHAAVRDRKPSRSLQLAVMRLVDRRGVFTATGRLRANASYCARHNTPFQGLAADGAKLALWLLWRSGYRIVNFIHDEVLVEVPADSDLRMQAEAIRATMIDAMKLVVPDVRIDVEYAASPRWYKSAEAVFDEEDQLLLWEPPKQVAVDVHVPLATVSA